MAIKILMYLTVKTLFTFGTSESYNGSPWTLRVLVGIVESMHGSGGCILRLVCLTFSVVLENWQLTVPDSKDRSVHFGNLSRGRLSSVLTLSGQRWSLH